MVFLGFVDAFLQVLAIIGIIIVGGFVIFFLGDIVLSILDPNYVRFGQRRKKEEKEEDVKQIEHTKEQPKELEFSFEDADEDAFVKADEVKPVVIEHPVEKQEEVKEEVKEEPVAEPEVKQPEEVDELKVAEEEFKKNMLKDIEERQKQKEEEEKENYNGFFFDDEDINVFEDEPIEGQEQIELEAPKEEEVQQEEPAAEEAEEPVEVVEPEEEEVVSSEIEDLKAQFAAEIARLQAKNEELEKELATKAEVGPTMGIEEYEARLETLKERLSANEKELRKVKKEYIPLRKVNRTLESDERKLRRKEAIVAKQKVVLYGVNNIADIDEEKAKKLSEELDLLEGLKLSVQHCEEVMAANKDRYPILENTYNILTNNNEALKADIKATEEAIEKLRAEAETEEVDVENGSEE